MCDLNNTATYLTGSGGVFFNRFDLIAYGLVVVFLRFTFGQPKLISYRRYS